MNKAELYNKIVDIYKKTGQGTAGFIRMKIGSDIIDELIEDGLIKSVVQTYSYLPNDEWLCLTKGYCVEENDHSALSFMRMYMKINPIFELGKIVFTLEDAFNNPDYVKGYNEWLEKNKEKLDEIKDIQYLQTDNLPELNSDVTEYLKSRRWYKENELISKCLFDLTETDVNNEKQLSIYEELIKLENMPSVRERYTDALKEHIKERDELKKEMKIRSKIKNWLLSKNQNEKIQSFI